MGDIFTWVVIKMSSQSENRNSGVGNSWVFSLSSNGTLFVSPCDQKQTPNIEFKLKAKKQRHSVSILRVLMYSLLFYVKKKINIRISPKLFLNTSI